MNASRSGLLGLVILAAGCGRSGSSGAFTNTDAGSEDATELDAGVVDSAASSDTSGDTNLSILGDGTIAETGACQHLNIGILGNPGSNASSDFQAWLVSAGTNVQRIQTTAPTPAIVAATLQPFDVVILDRLTRDYAAAEASALAAFVTSGGGVVSMSGYDGVTTDDWHANSLLSPLGVAYSGPLLDGPITSFASHPITMGLTSVTFAGGYAISDLGGTASTRTPIAFLPDPMGTGNVDVAYAIQLGSGRAFVWGDEWIEFDSQWSTLPEIKQLWVQVFAWISPTNKCALMPQ